ncbi:MspA family porin [Nocardia sp. CNY236]|uniref:MspA family porin n=1 Tax=Nocardia sp. CNY236 TaxID=1169152 RepID=UPI00042335AC|nr:MspA family porin [Nocardia sp. CNY236]
MINRKNAARLAAVGAATSVAVGMLASGPANADTYVPLPGGEISKSLSDGTVVTVRLLNESANINPSMGATPVHRNAWVSGTAYVELSGSNAMGGKIYPGYVVGCQVNIDGGGVDGGVSAGSDWEGESPEVGGSGGAALSLGPGEAKSFYVLDLEEADDYGNESHQKRNKFKGQSGSVTWADSTIGLSGCGGYAQARAFVKVKVETENVQSVMTLWGQPFSIG